MGEEVKRKKLAGIKKVKKGERAPSSSSESESGSDNGDDEDALMKEKKPEGPKTSSTAPKLTGALGSEKNLVQEKDGMPAVKEKAASPRKSSKTKENKLPVPAAVSKSVEQGKAVALKSKQTKSTLTVSKAGLKEKAASPVKSLDASPAKSFDA